MFVIHYGLKGKFKPWAKRANFFWVELEWESIYAHHQLNASTIEPLYLRLQGTSQKTSQKFVRARGTGQDLCYEIASSMYDWEAVPRKSQHYACQARS